MHHGVFRQHLPTFLARAAASARGRRLPKHVRGELTRYLDCGVLAAAASRRAEIVPGPGREGSGCPRHEAADAAPRTARAKRVRRHRPERRLWAELMARVFELDVLACPCGGRRKVLAMVFRRESIEQVLRSLGLPCEVAPRAPPRGVQGELSFEG